MLWWIKETARWWEIEAHDFESCCLFVQCICHSFIWLLDQWSKSWICPGLIVWGCPQSWNWWSLSNHLVLKLSISNCFCQILWKNCGQVSMSASDIWKTPCKINISIVFDQIGDSQEKCGKSILNNINSKHSSRSNRNRVSINASISLLVNWMLTFGRRNFFFSWISAQMSL